MAKKKKEMNYKEMDVEELDRQLQKNQMDLFKLRFRSASAPIKNVMTIRSIRRDIARLHTFISQKRRQTT